MTPKQLLQVRLQLLRLGRGPLGTSFYQPCCVHAVCLQDWAELGAIAHEALQDYNEGRIDEPGLEERMCGPVMYFVSVPAPEQPAF